MSISNGSSGKRPARDMDDDEDDESCDGQPVSSRRRTNAATLSIESILERTVLLIPTCMEYDLDLKVKLDEIQVEGKGILVVENVEPGSWGDSLGIMKEDIVVHPDALQQGLQECHLFETYDELDSWASQFDVIGVARQREPTTDTSGTPVLVGNEQTETQAMLLHRESHLFVLYDKSLGCTIDERSFRSLGTIYVHSITDVNGTAARCGLKENDILFHPDYFERGLEATSKCFFGSKHALRQYLDSEFEEEKKRFVLIGIARKAVVLAPALDRRRLPNDPSALVAPPVVVQQPVLRRRLPNDPSALVAPPVVVQQPVLQEAQQEAQQQRIQQRIMYILREITPDAVQQRINSLEIDGNTGRQNRPSWTALSDSEKKWCIEKAAHISHNMDFMQLMAMEVVISDTTATIAIDRYTTNTNRLLFLIGVLEVEGELLGRSKMQRFYDRGGCSSSGLYWMYWRIKQVANAAFSITDFGLERNFRKTVRDLQESVGFDAVTIARSEALARGFITTAENKAMSEDLEAYFQLNELNKNRSRRRIIRSVIEEHGVFPDPFLVMLDNAVKRTLERRLAKGTRDRTVVRWPSKYDGPRVAVGEVEETIEVRLLRRQLIRYEECTKVHVNQNEMGRVIQLSRRALRDVMRRGAARYGESEHDFVLVRRWTHIVGQTGAVQVDHCMPIELFDMEDPLEVQMVFDPSNYECMDDTENASKGAIPKELCVYFYNIRPQSHVQYSIPMALSGTEQVTGTWCSLDSKTLEWDRRAVYDIWPSGGVPLQYHGSNGDIQSRLCLKDRWEEKNDAALEVILLMYLEERDEGEGADYERLLDLVRMLVVLRTRILHFGDEPNHRWTPSPACP